MNYRDMYIAQMEIEYPTQKKNGFLAKYKYTLLRYGRGNKIFNAFTKLIVSLASVIGLSLYVLETNNICW